MSELGGFETSKQAKLQGLGYREPAEYKTVVDFCGTLSAGQSRKQQRKLAFTITYASKRPPVVSPTYQEIGTYPTSSQDAVESLS